MAVEAATISGTVTSTTGLTNAYLLYRATNPNSTSFNSPLFSYVVEPIGNVNSILSTPPATTYSFDLAVRPSFYGQGDAVDTPTDYTIIGIYNGVDPTGDGSTVALAFDSTDLTVPGSSFDSQIAGFEFYAPSETGNGEFRQVTEADVQAYLQTNDTSALQSIAYFLLNRDDDRDITGLSVDPTTGVGELGTLYNFSSATAAGATTAAVLPEPAVATMTVGALAFAGMRRKRCAR